MSEHGATYSIEEAGDKSMGLYDEAGNRLSTVVDALGQAEAQIADLRAQLYQERATRYVPYMVSAWNALAADIHQVAVDHGFWDGERNDGELIALMHSELSEMLEALRHGNPPSDHIPEYSGAEEELADLLIRALDMSAGRGYDLAGALLAKIGFNRGRPHKHGKEF